MDPQQQDVVGIDPVHCQTVGKEFVHRYFDILRQDPASLHQLYTPSCKFVFGNLADELDAANGQKAVQKRITELDLQGCHVDIRRIDSQSTPNNGVFVQVIGKLAKREESPRNFQQSFVLVSIETRYLVQNSVFRFQDELFYVPVPKDHQQENVAGTNPVYCQTVGKGFVRHYFNMFRYCPASLHKFYGPSSTFLFGDLGEKVETVTGKSAVKKRIMELDLEDCSADIGRIDCQSTLDNGILVQVIGKLSKDEGRPRKFQQLFVLALVKTKYILQTSIFRFQDGESYDVTTNEEYTEESAERYVFSAEVTEDSAEPKVAKASKTRSLVVCVAVPMETQKGNMAGTNPVYCQEVGEEFVRQYFIVLELDPTLLHTFYGPCSRFIFGDIGGKVRTVTGQKAVGKRINKLNLHSCHVNIWRIDSQSTLDNGILVQVIGTLARRKKRPRKFQQSFVLALVETRYILQTSIFRFRHDETLKSPQNCMFLAQKKKTKEPAKPEDTEISYEADNEQSDTEVEWATD